MLFGIHVYDEDIFVVSLFSKGLPWSMVVRNHSTDRDERAGSVAFSLSNFLFLLFRSRYVTFNVPNGLASFSSKKMA